MESLLTYSYHFLIRHSSNKQMLFILQEKNKIKNSITGRSKLSMNYMLFIRRMYKSITQKYKQI